MRVHSKFNIKVGLAAAAVIVAVSTQSGHAASQRDTLLTPVSWLAQHLHDPNLVILAVGDPATYPKEHVPGAEVAEMQMFAAPRDTTGAALSLELPTDDSLHKALEGLGVSDASRIVIVESDNYHSPSTRIYLTLVHAGLGSRTSLLDGGLPTWKAAGQPTTAEVPKPRTGTLKPLKTVAVTVDSAYVQAHERSSGFAVLDVRSPAAWDGVEPAGARGAPPKFGHVPGSHSLPLEQLWDDSASRLKPASELEKIFADAGVKPGDTIVGYCYVGQRATATLFAAKTLGHTVLLYDGSMEEWSKLNLPLEMPVKKGAR